MIHTTLKRISAGFLLLILMSAYVGQKAHIYTEDLQHFAAFSGDLVPDNGACSAVSEHCTVCNYEFFPYLEEGQSAHQFYFDLLAVLLPEPTCCKCCDAVSCLRLRAPPVA